MLKLFFGIFISILFPVLRDHKNKQSGQFLKQTIIDYFPDL